MADFASYLPFSRREPVDESGVGSDWRTDIGATLNAIADVLGGLSADDWEVPSMSAGWRVRDVAGHLVWRIGSSTRELLSTGSRAYLGHFVDPDRAIDVLSRAAAEAAPAELVRRIREIAAEKAGEHVRHGIRELSEAVVHGYDISRPLGVALPVSAAASGAVALRRGLIAPTEIKAVTRHRTLVASDAGWRVGRGPDLTATAEELVLFLYGRAGVTPLLF